MTCESFAVGKLYHTTVPALGWKRLPYQASDRDLNEVKNLVVEIPVGAVLIHLEQSTLNGGLQRFLFKEMLLWISSSYLDYLRPGKYVQPEIVDND